MGLHARIEHNDDFPERVHKLRIAARGVAGAVMKPVSPSWLARAVGLVQLLLGGALSIAWSAAPAEAEPPVQLPDFVVRGIYPEAPERPWFYGKVGEFELVSDFPEAEVKEYLEELQRAHVLLDYWLPRELRSAARIPYRIVLSRDSLPHSGAPLRFKGRGYSFGESLNLWHGTIGHSASGLEEVHVNPDVDTGRASHGPRWTKYEEARAKFVASRVYWAAFNALFRASPRYATWADIVFKGARWGIGFDGHAVVLDGSQDRRRKTEVPPIDLRQLLALGGAERPLRVAASPSDVSETAEWFGVWGVYGDGGKHREALWKLARAAAVPSVNAEALFEEFFGLSVDEAERRIANFRRQLFPPRELGEASAQTEIPFQAALVPIEFRPATQTDKACLVGEWCWGAARNYPKVAEALRQAGLRHMQRAARTERFDARVAGWQGMLELASGDKASAGRWLEESIKEGAAEPLFRFELAQLILEEATVGRGTDTGSTALDPAQASRIAALLRDVWCKRPDFVGAYELALRVWKSGPPPSSEDLHEFAVAVAQFPRESKLVANTALLCLRHEMKLEAERLAILGAAGAKNDAARAAFEKLRAMMRQLEKVPR